MVGSREDPEEHELHLHRDYLSTECACHCNERCGEQLGKHNLLHEEHQMTEAWHYEMQHKEATTVPPHLLTIENTRNQLCHNIPVTDAFNYRRGGR